MRSALAIVVCGLVFMGCVPTLYPLYTDKDLTFNEQLMGTFRSDDASWVFTKAADKACVLEYTGDDGKLAKFNVHLLTLDGVQFLDLYPEDMGVNDVSPVYKAHFMPVHSFLRVISIGDDVSLAVMQPDWLKETLAKEPTLVAHGPVEDIILLTAPTAELQAFINKQLANKEAWGDPVPLKRQAAPAK